MTIEDSFMGCMTVGKDTESAGRTSGMFTGEETGISSRMVELR